MRPSRPCRVARPTAPTHGMSKHPAYHIWRTMIARCHLKSQQAYNRYGGRGIKVCRRWRMFENFWADNEHDVQSWLNPRALEQLKRLFPCKLHMDNTDSPITQHTNQSYNRHAERLHASLRSGGTKRHKRENFSESDPSRVACEHNLRSTRSW
jgi:hypothetical protein